MMPSQVVFVESLPYTSSGKIDRKRLPKPNQTETWHKSNTKPETLLENKLLTLWINLLSSEKIEVTDNFYDVGGNSLLAIKLSMQIATIFSIEPDIISIMEYPTIRDYAIFLDSKMSSKQISNHSISGKNMERSKLMRSRYSKLIKRSNE